MSSIVLFDGLCNLCNGSVQFIIRRDPKACFKFASLQSDIGNSLLEEYNIPRNTDSFILIENGKYYQRSTAALRVCKHLKGFWKVFYIFIIVPRPVRDLVYWFVSKNRYKWFGKQDSCMMPTVEYKQRFLN